VRHPENSRCTAREDLYPLFNNKALGWPISIYGSDSQHSRPRGSHFTCLVRSIMAVIVHFMWLMIIIDPNMSKKLKGSAGDESLCTVVCGSTERMLPYPVVFTSGWRCYCSIPVSPQSERKEKLALKIVTNLYVILLGEGGSCPGDCEGQVTLHHFYYPVTLHHFYYPVPLHYFYYPVTLHYFYYPVPLHYFYYPVTLHYFYYPVPLHYFYYPVTLHYFYYPVTLHYYTRPTPPLPIVTLPPLIFTIRSRRHHRSSSSLLMDTTTSFIVLPPPHKNKYYVFILG
ncbi:hypothetical protein Hamer_G007749, partial [Homarus americanus]